MFLPTLTIEEGINFRKGAFPAHALGLLASAHVDIKIEGKGFRAVEKSLSGPDFANRDIPLSTVPALKLLAPDLAPGAPGLLGNKEDFPWSSKSAFGLNFRAVVETLAGSADGILYIL